MFPCHCIKVKSSQLITFVLKSIFINLHYNFYIYRFTLVNRYILIEQPVMLFHTIQFIFSLQTTYGFGRLLVSRSPMHLIKQCKSYFNWRLGFQKAFCTMWAAFVNTGKNIFEYDILSSIWNILKKIRGMSFYYSRSWIKTRA